MRLIVFVFVMGVAATQCFAQDNGLEISPSSLQESLDNLRAEVASKEAGLIALGGQLAAIEAEKDAGYFEARSNYYLSLSDYYDYQQKLRERTIATLRWQTISSYVLLLLVIVVAGLGSLLAYQEVRKSLEVGELLKDKPQTEFIIEVKKIQINSAVTGVVILVISLGFLFLFVDRVMELNPVSLADGVALGVQSEEDVDDAEQ